MRRVRTGLVGIVGGWLAASGCGTPQQADEPAAVTYSGVELRVASIAAGADTPGVPADSRQSDQRTALRLIEPLNAQRGEWEASRKARVVVDPQPLAADQGPATAAAQILAFPAERLGELVDAGRLEPVPPSALRPRPGDGTDDAFAYSDVLPAFRDHVARYGDELMALPLGGSALVLVIRRDALERPENQAAAKEAGIVLEPPATYPQLDALARFLQGRDWSGDGQPDHGIALALGQDPEGVAEMIYLARAAALGHHPDHFAFLFDDETMEPRIDDPPFVAALEELAALAELGPPDAAAFDAEAARAAYRQGRAAILIDLAERAASWTDPKQPVASVVAPLPGSPRVFDPDRGQWQPMDPPNRPSYLPRGGGWLAGLAAGSSGAQRDAALDFLRYLASPETTGRLLADRDFPVLSTRSSQIGAAGPDSRRAPGIDAKSWTRAVDATLQAAEILPGLRIPEADGYLADLAARCREAVAGSTPAESALHAAADAWRARTERLGTQRQLWHYRRSLNRPTATTTPPPRSAPGA